MKAGFTLVEVVVALILLEVAVVGALGFSLAAAERLGRAERMGRATMAAMSLVDSLASTTTVGSDSIRFEPGWLRWTLDSGGLLRVEAASDDETPLVRLESWVEVR